MKTVDYILTYLIFLILKFCFVKSFNLDVENAVIYGGPAGSYFGYTTAILKNKEGTWILAGAPRGEDIYQPFVSRPGALYKCPYPPTTSPSCTQVNVDSKGETEQTVVYHGRNVTFRHQKADQWLGVALDVEPVNHSSVLVCAHRWADSYIQHKMGGIAHMNGLCYLLGAELEDEGRVLPALTVTERLVSGQGYAQFSMGSLGMAASITEGQYFMAAPGLNDWSGGLAIETNEDEIEYIETSRLLNQDSYIGYSMATGKFVYRNALSIALGAPRAGRVYFFSLSATSKSAGSQRPLSFIECKQVGSYFGAAIVSLDLNGDHMDDVIVGAPTFSDTGVDQGKVFVYFSKGIVGFQKSDSELHGENVEFSRFGTALVALGDINNDGFQDIAVGAPYENINGAVYVYNGYEDGIFPKHTQRILGHAVSRKLQGFGISFSRPYDIDVNGINDIVVGAHTSGHVTVLKSKQVLDMQATFHLKPSELSQNSTCYVLGKRVLCIRVQICFYYKEVLTSTYQQVDLKYKVKLDSNKPHSDTRAVVIDISNYRIRHLPFFEGNVTVYSDEITCTLPKMVYLRKSYIEDFEPMPLEVIADVKSERCRDCPTLNFFNGNSTTPFKHSIYKTEVPFEEKCLHTRKCESVLDLQGKLFSKNQTFGTTSNPKKLLEILTTITNHGDVASSLEVTHEVPRDLTFYRVFELNSERSIPCSTFYHHQQNSTNNVYFILCSVGNLHYQQSVSVVSQFHCRNYSREVYEIETSLETKSNVSQTSNMTIGIAVPMAEAPSLRFLGVSLPSELIVSSHKLSRMSSLLRDEYAHFSHVFTIYNEGPSILREGQFLLNLNFCDGVRIQEIQTYTKRGTTVDCTAELPALTGKANQVQNFAGEAQRVRCEVINLGAMSFIHINVSLNIPIADKVDQQDEWNFTTSAYFVHRIYSQQQELNENITTTVVFLSWQPMDPQLEYWIIAMSSLFGLLIILTTSVTCWKCGFFKRKDKELLHRLIQKRNLILARTLSSESDALLSDDSSDTMVMTPPPSYRDVNSSCSNSRTSSQAETIQNEAGHVDDYVEPLQTTV